MDCDALPDTGGPALWALAVAVALLLGGSLLLLRARHGRKPSAVGLLLVVILGAGGLLADVAHAHADASDCVTPDRDTNNSLTITQISIIEGLAPNVAPTRITGRVRNNAQDTTFITAVTVSISSVVKAPGAPAGTCDSSDYILLNPRMPVGQTLGSLGSVDFSGASIGFKNTSTNQDACKSATVNLLYISAPGPSEQPK